MTLDALIKVLSLYRIRYGSEAEMQSDVANVLDLNDIPYEREFQIGKGAIDFLVGIDRCCAQLVQHTAGDCSAPCIAGHRCERHGGPLAAGMGIECKVAGGPALVIPQLQRYASDPRVSSLLLCTSRAVHRFPQPTLVGKPFRTHFVATGSL